MKTCETSSDPAMGIITYYEKYGVRDHRGGGRASGRETAARVAAGAVARKVIAREGIRVMAFTRELAGISAKTISLEDIDKNPLFCPDPEAAAKMMEELERAKEMGDSVGGIVEIRVQGCPPGLGEPVFDKMDADLAKALMSIGTVKGVEIGAGFEAARLRGSENNDPLGPNGFLTNRAGGILAGITTGEEIVIRVSCKPIASIRKEQNTIDIFGKAPENSHRRKARCFRHPAHHSGVRSHDLHYDGRSPSAKENNREMSTPREKSEIGSIGGTGGMEMVSEFLPTQGCGRRRHSGQAKATRNPGFSIDSGFRLCRNDEIAAFCRRLIGRNHSFHQAAGGGEGSIGRGLPAAEKGSNSKS